MSSIPKTRASVKSTPRRNHYTQSSRNTPLTVDEFLKINPLPPQLKHMDAAIRKLPFGLLIELIIGGAATGATDEQICAGLLAAATAFATSDHRCSACFGWTDTEHVFSVVVDGVYRFGSCCERCRGKIIRGAGTPTMRRNICEHFLDGDK